jgi:hypothetical protein
VTQGFSAFGEVNYSLRRYDVGEPSRFARVLRRAKRDASLAFCLKPGRGNSFWVLDCEAIPESDQSIPSQEISRVVKTKGQAFFNGGTKSPEFEPERVGRDTECLPCRHIDGGAVQIGEKPDP